MSGRKVLSLLPAVFSLLMMIGTVTVFRACPMKDDGTWMHCHTAQNVVAAAGGVMCVLLLIAAFVNNRMVRTALYGLCIAGFVGTFLTPGVLISMCMMDTMRCYAVMQPFVRIMSGAALVCAAIAAARGADGPKSNS